MATSHDLPPLRRGYQANRPQSSEQPQRPQDTGATAAALLGLLHEGLATVGNWCRPPAAVFGSFFSVIRSQVYRELPALIDAGLVRLGKQGPRSSQQYLVTAAGKKAFKSWLAGEPGPDHLRSPLILRLAHANALTARQRAALVESAKKLYSEEQDAAKAAANSADDAYAKAIAEFGIAQAKANCSTSSPHLERAHEGQLRNRLISSYRPSRALASRVDVDRFPGTGCYSLVTREHANKTRTSDEDGEPVRYTVLSHRAIALWAVLIVAAGVGMAVWLLLAYGAGGDPRVQLDAIRTAGTVVVGAGGAAALLLAARRQRTAEIALKQKDRDQADVARAHALQERVAAETRVHQEQVAKDAREDAAARRITELYTAAAAHLGSDKAPVRLAGLYALERLAQDNPNQRQTIVNVLCAYLRMPYTLPEGAPVGDVDPDRALHTERMQEREVRLTAQGVLAAHLQPVDRHGPVEAFWADIDLDLTGAVLINFNLRNCHLRNAQFNYTKFVGHAHFDGTEFAWRAGFIGAEFADRARFDRTNFKRPVSFGEAQFVGDADFNTATFAEVAWFDETHFDSNVTFDHTAFAEQASFDRAKFAGIASSREARFADDTSFRTSFQATVFVLGAPSELERFWSPPADGEIADPAAEPDGRPD